MFILFTVDDFIVAIAQNMNPEHLSVCNNATWALGEVAIRLGNHEDHHFVVKGVV